MSKKTWLITALLLLCAQTAFAQIDISVPMTAPPYGQGRMYLSAPVMSEEPMPLLRFRPFDLAGPEVRDRDGWRGMVFDDVLNGLLYGALYLDAQSTFEALELPGIHEANPIMRPFVNAGPSATFAVTSGLTYLSIRQAERMKRHPSRFIRSISWFPKVLGIVGHSYAALHNNEIAERRRARLGL